MFSKSLNFRFTALFSGFFLIGSLLLFVFTYLFLAGSLRREEEAAIRSKLLEFWAVYQTGKTELVRRELSLERLVTEERLFMLRIAGRRNNTLFVYLPAHWGVYDPGRLDSLPLAGEGELVALPSREGPGELRVASVQLPDGNILQIGMTNTRRLQVLQRFRRTFLLVFVPLGLLSVLGGFAFSSRSLRPVRQLAQATREIVKTGQMDARIPPRGSQDELDELVALFNQMLAKIDSLIRAMRESLDNVAHDLRTPLTRLRGNAELALGEGEGIGACREALRNCLEESERILTMLSTLMDISEAENGVMRLERRPVDLAALVADMVELYGYAAEEKGIAVTQSSPGHLNVSVDLNRMRQVVANLLDNAVKYTPEGGSIAVDARKEGDWVLAVGNPLGFSSTITSGIVSALGRNALPGSDLAGFTDYIQTDAAINQGNSGGALVNINGQVVGINAWIASPSGGNVGLGFAIPINDAKRDIEDFLTKGKVEYGWLGVFIGDLSKELASQLKAGDARGAFVPNVYKGSPADKASIQPGDIITSVNGTRVESSNQLMRVVGGLTPGEITRFELLREGKAMTATARITAREEEKTISEQAKKIWPGLYLASLTDDLRKQLDLEGGIEGVLVANVVQGSPADVAGLRQGDVIQQINGNRVTGLGDFYSYLNGRGREVNFRILRQSVELSIGLVR